MITHCKGYPKSYTASNGLRRVGYNAFCRDAHPDDRKEKVIDLGSEIDNFKFKDENYSYPSRYLKAGILLKRDRKLRVCESITQLQEEYSADLDRGFEIPLFSAEFKTKFKKEIKSRQERYFAIYHDIFKTYSLNVFNKPSFRKALTSVFSDICSRDPKEIYDSFGTHVIAGITCGGVVKWHTSVEKTQVKNKHEFEIAVKGAFKGFKGGTSVGTKSARQDIRDNLEETLEIMGGDPSLVTTAKKGGKDLERFFKSVENPCNVVVIETVLDPIDNYVPAEKKEELREYIIQEGRKLTVKEYDIRKKMAKDMLNQKWSIESSNYPQHYIRHRGAEFYIDRYDGSEQFEKDSTFILRKGNKNYKPCMRFESINYPRHYMRHGDYKINLRSISKDTHKLDSSFIPRHALNGKDDCFSLESVHYPGFFVRHQHYRVRIDKEKDTEIFKNDASWKLKKWAK